MCRLFAYTTKDAEKTNKLCAEALGEFRMLAEKGCVPCGIASGHLDGWGIVAYKNGAPVFYVRSNDPAHTDEKYESALALLISYKPDIVIAHLRKATRGGSTFGNTQPFLAGDLSFCHNGTIEQVPERDGKSDSRIFFEDVVSNYSAIQSFKEAYARYEEKHPYTAMNMLFSDGKTVLATRNWNESNPKAEEQKLADYYTLYKASLGAATFICSEKISCFSDAGLILLRNGTFTEI